MANIFSFVTGIISGLVKVGNLCFTFPLRTFGNFSHSGQALTLQGFLAIFNQVLSQELSF